MGIFEVPMSFLSGQESKNRALQSKRRTQLFSSEAEATQKLWKGRTGACAWELTEMRLKRNICTCGDVDTNMTWFGAFFWVFDFVDSWLALSNNQVTTQSNWSLVESCGLVPLLQKKKKKKKNEARSGECKWRCCYGANQNALSVHHVKLFGWFGMGKKITSLVWW